MNNDIHVRDWMKNCPYLQNSTVAKDGRLEYGIYPSPVTTSYHENVLGEMVADEIQEMSFVFTAKREYKTDRASLYAFYQNVFNWVEDQNRIGNFPKINEGRVRSVVPQLSQYVSEPNNGNERSELQIRVTYKRNNV